MILALDVSHEKSRRDDMMSPPKFCVTPSGLVKPFPKSTIISRLWRFVLLIVFRYRH